MLQKLYKAILPQEDYFEWHLKFLRFFLLNRPKGNGVKKILFYIVAFAHLFCTGITALTMELLALYFSHHDTFGAAMLNVGMAAMHSVGIARVLGWFFVIGDKFTTVINMIKRETFEFSVFNIRNFEPCSFSSENRNKTNAVDTYRIKKMAETRIFCSKLFLLFFSYVSVNITFSYTTNAYTDTTEHFNPNLNRTSIYRSYVYPLYYPFDTSVSDGYYWSGFFYQPYAFNFLMSSFMVIDFYGNNSIIYLTNQVKVVTFAFRQIDKNIDETIPYKEINLIKEIRLVKCIQELQVIYKASQLIEDLSNFMLLIQIMGCNVIAFSLIYYFESISSTVEYLWLASMILVVLQTPLMTCLIDQNFTVEVLNVLESIRELDWITYPPSMQRKLVFLTMRVQKPFRFTLLGSAILDMSFYQAFLKMTYSFYTLVTNTRNKK